MPARPALARIDIARSRLSESGIYGEGARKRRPQPSGFPAFAGMTVKKIGGDSAIIVHFSLMPTRPSRALTFQRAFPTFPLSIPSFPRKRESGRLQPRPPSEIRYKRQPADPISLYGLTDLYFPEAYKKRLTRGRKRSILARSDTKPYIPYPNFPTAL